MNNIKIFDQDLPNEIDLSNEKAIGLDCEALGLVLGRDPLTLVQLGLESKKYFLVKSLDKAKIFASEPLKPYIDWLGSPTIVTVHLS